MGNDYPLILSLDTTTRCSCVALTRGTLDQGEVLASLSLSSNITHSRRLIHCVDQLFRETQCDWPDVKGVGIGLGPGSFTGLRIGMATAKGFAAAAGIKLLGVSTLDSLAAQCVTSKTVCAVIDARKKQVYAALYKRDEQNMVVRQGDLRAVSPENLVREINEPVVMVGDGVESYGPLWRKELGSAVQFAPPQLNQVSAAVIGLLCGQKYADQHFLDVGEAAPLYVRASDAELSLSDTKKKKH